MAHSTGSTKVWQRRDRHVQLAIWSAWLIATAIFVYCFQLISEKTIWAFVWDAPVQAGDLAARMVPPDWKYIHQLWRPLWDTLNIATIGTLISIVLAVPVAPGDTVMALRGSCDHVVCLAEPQPFRAVGDHYLDFHQVDDMEVMAAFGAEQQE